MINEDSKMSEEKVYATDTIVEQVVDAEKQLKDLYGELEKQLKDLYGELCSKVFEAFFQDFPELNFVGFYGYTPSFNDGDPCEHWHHGFGEYIEMKEYGIGENDESCPEGARPNPDSYYDYGNTVVRKIGGVSNKLANLFESAYGTGWEVVAIRNEDGSITVTKEEYDCGY
jgi:hypothetical protein